MDIQELKDWTKETGLYKTGHGYNYWVEILSDKAKAPEDGIYLIFLCTDNQLVYVLSHCSLGDSLEEASFYTDAMPIAFHPITPYSAEAKSWTEYRSGDKAKIYGIYVWFIRRNGKEEYVYRSYKKGEDMLPFERQSDNYDIDDKFQDCEFIAYHGCFEYSRTQFSLHWELCEKFNQ